MTGTPYPDAARQRETAIIGLWVFLATEMLFFGGLLLAYTVYREADAAGFAAASRHTLIGIGTVNSAILLTSSATMA